MTDDDGDAPSCPGAVRGIGSGVVGAEDKAEVVWRRGKFALEVECVE